MTMMSRTTSFETTDLALGAFLLSRGHALLNVETLAGGRRVFCFPPDVQAEARSFYQNAAVPARAFANALRDLKALVRET